MKFTFIAIVATLAMSLIGCETRSVTDATITTTVKGKLVAAPETSATRINVDTSSGVVTLSGAVPTVAEKSEAEQIARNTEGVRQVINNVTVAPEKPSNGEEVSDTMILTSVKSQLVTNGIIGANVDVMNGEVTIKGTVESVQEKSRAEEIARKTAGVKSVRNQLTIKQK